VPVDIVQIKPADNDLIIELGVGSCNKERKKKPAKAYIKTDSCFQRELHHPNKYTL
jgi:hypothetical protein